MTSPYTHCLYTVCQVFISPLQYLAFLSNCSTEHLYSCVWFFWFLIMLDLFTDWCILPIVLIVLPIVCLFGFACLYKYDSVLRLFWYKLCTWILPPSLSHIAASYRIHNKYFSQRTSATDEPANQNLYKTLNSSIRCIRLG